MTILKGRFTLLVIGALFCTFVITGCGSGSGGDEADSPTTPQPQGTLPPPPPGAPR